MNTSGRSALAVFIIKNNEVIYQKGFGKANKETNTDATAQTPFLLASVSKGITGLVLMKLYDEGRFQLDEDINNYLPFSVRNPNFPDTPITFRMLMAHASSIGDATYNELGDDVYKFDGTDFDQSNPNNQVGTLMKDLLDPSGRYYNEGGQSSYLSYRPGEGTTYSNTGSALCGYLAERIAGEDFASYSKKVLFDPLGMTNTSWRLNDLDNSKIAMPYNTSGAAIGHYTFIDYPNGGLRSSVEDMSKIMLLLMQNGTVNGVQILKSSTVELLKQKTTQFTNSSGTTYGLKWFYDKDGNEAEIFGHNGGERGVTSQFFYNPATGIGFMAVSNKTDDNLQPIQDALFNEGEK